MAACSQVIRQVFGHRGAVVGNQQAAMIFYPDQQHGIRRFNAWLAGLATDNVYLYGRIAQPQTAHNGVRNMFVEQKAGVCHVSASENLGWFNAKFSSLC